MMNIMAEMRYEKASQSYEQSKAEIRRAIAKAKMSILAAEKQLELGAVPQANLTQAEQCIGLAIHESEKTTVYDEAMKFYGEVVVA